MAGMGNMMRGFTGPFGARLGRVIAVVIVAYLVVTGIVGMFWSSEPEMFSVQQHAQQRAIANNEAMVKGYTTTETLREVADTLLTKPGGYLSNDIMPPGLWLDNIPNWEQGVIIQVRDMARAMRSDFSRSQSQSTEDPDLAVAERQFNVSPYKWWFPSTESQYRLGIQALENYQSRLVQKGQAGESLFYARSDSLRNWLSDVSTRLGSLSQRLSASVGQVRLDTDTTDHAVYGDGETNAEGILVKTPWMKIDDVFYEARGQTWALSHLLRAVEVDFADVLAKKNATVSLRQIIRELDAAQEAVWSPMIVNGNGFGLLANHSLVMANYISRANAAIIDLRNLLAQG